jgi:hypothetical protein
VKWVDFKLSELSDTNHDELTFNSEVGVVARVTLEAVAFTSHSKMT